MNSNFTEPDRSFPANNLLLMNEETMKRIDAPTDVYCVIAQ